MVIEEQELRFVPAGRRLCRAATDGDNAGAAAQTRGVSDFNGVRQRQGVGVEGLPDDHAIDAVVFMALERTDVVEAGDAAAGNDLQTCKVGQCRRRLHVYSAEQAIAADVGEQRQLHAQCGHAVAQLDRTHLADLLPAVGGDHPVLCIEPNDDPAYPPALEGNAHQLRIAYSHGPQYDTVGTQGKGQFDVLDAAQPAGELNRDIDRLPDLDEALQVYGQMPVGAGFIRPIVRFKTRVGFASRLSTLERVGGKALDFGMEVR